jgi:hypothetical protein
MKFMRIDVGKQMKRVLAALLICTGLCASVSVHSQTLSYNDTVKQMVRFTLVYLTVKGRLPDGTEIPPIEATGFLVSDDGHVVTAKHAVLSATHWEQYTERLVANNKTPLTYWTVPSFPRPPFGSPLAAHHVCGMRPLFY